MAQIILDIFPNAVSHYGLLGCALFALSALSGFAMVAAEIISLFARKE